MIKKTFMDGGAAKEFVDTVSTGVADDVIPLITQLKYHFNRPRPGQLAHYYGINLFPDHSYFTNNPSFPSGHTCLTVVTCNVLGNLYPEMFKKMLPVIKEVMDSRVSLGVHFPSDNDMSMVVAKSILANPEFKANYHL
jgi:membrane-associated phospholipid phosphatase